MAGTVRIAQGREVAILKRAMDGWSKQVAEHIQEESYKRLNGMAKTVQKSVRAKIASGATGVPLASSTADRKGSDKRLVETGEYARSVTVRMATTGHSKFRKINAGVGVDARKVDPIVPIVHEFGGKGIPKRPHWFPEIQKLMQSPEYKEFLKGRWIRAGVPYRG